MSSFKLVAKEHSTTLSSHIWELKRQEKQFKIKWVVMEHAPIYTPESKVCRLCTAEKTNIARLSNLAGPELLNSRAEILARCPHRDKHLLVNHVVSHNPPQVLQTR